MKPGARTRWAPYYDLWVTGYLDLDGTIITGDTRQYQYNKVYPSSFEIDLGNARIIPPSILDIRNRLTKFPNRGSCSGSRPPS